MSRSERRGAPGDRRRRAPAWLAAGVLATLVATVAATALAQGGGPATASAKLQAQEQEVAACMKAAGLAWDALVPKSFLIFEARRAGDDAEADRLQSTPDSNETRALAMSAADRETYWTTHERCAERVLGRPVDAAALRSRFDDMVGKQRASDELAEADATWLACMADHRVTIDVPVDRTRESYATPLPGWSVSRHLYGLRVPLFGEDLADGEWGSLGPDDPRVRAYQDAAAQVTSAQRACTPAHSAVFERVHAKALEEINQRLGPMP